MGLFATVERDPHLIDQRTLTRLAGEFKDRNNSRPESSPSIFIFGYLTQTAAEDAVKEDIERGLMNRGIQYVSRWLSQLGIPADRIYINEHVISAMKSRKIDLFLQQRGETATFPANAPISSRRAKDFLQPKDADKNAVKVNSNQELVLEVTAYAIKADKRTVLKEIALKSITGISPSQINTKFYAELSLWKPKLHKLLRKIGQDGMADKVQFSFKLTGGGTKSKDFGDEVKVAVSASLKAALSVQVSVPGTKHEVTIELSFSYGVSYKAEMDRITDGSVGDKGKGMVEVTLFRF